MMAFKDRRDAGERLADALTDLKDEKCLVAAIPRGGVVVGYYVAERFGWPLEVVVPRKIGAPYQPELAVGAVAEDGTIYVEEEVARVVGVDMDWIRAAAEKELEEVKRRIELYRGGAELPKLDEYIVIVVDDGVATGATMIATVRFLKKLQSRKVIVAIPVAPPEVLPKLRAEADEVRCLETPIPFYAIGQFYMNFAQVSDTEVMDYLSRGRRLLSPK
ncbi:MAG: phosphoribosyltransferase [Thaumarchaeota archaeon]|nr:MAG: phosphoribosyltransferase [Nitrososphaerota archaeon]